MSSRRLELALMELLLWSAGCVGLAGNGVVALDSQGRIGNLRGEVLDAGPPRRTWRPAADCQGQMAMIAMPTMTSISEKPASRRFFPSGALRADVVRFRKAGKIPQRSAFLSLGHTPQRGRSGTP